MTYMIEIFLMIVCCCGCFMVYAECDGDCCGDYNNTSNENTSTECEISVVKSPIADAQLENA